MTEYDFSPEAYDRYIQTQNRVANWVSHTEQHRQVFEAAAPGAPGIPVVPRRQSPPMPQRYAPPHRPSPYPMAPIYRAPPSSSSSEESYVHVAPPQIRRMRPPPPPIYAPPAPPAPFPVQSHPSPVAVRVDGDRLSPSSSRRHHRSKSHSHSYRSPPPLVTPVYTSPAASPFIPPPPIIYMSSQGYTAPPSARPVMSSRELYRKPSSPRKAHQYHRPPAPPATPSSTSSSSSDDTPTSSCHTSSPNSPTTYPFPPSPAPAAHPGPSTPGPGGSRTQVFSARPQDQPQYRRHILPSLDPPHISHNLQDSSSNIYQRSGCQNPQHTHHYLHQDQSRRSNTSSSQSTSYIHSQPRHRQITPRPQPYARHSDPCYDYDRPPHLSTATNISHDGVISVLVPHRYPIDDRELESPLYTSSSSRARKNRVPTAPLVLHAPKPIRHPNMLSPRLPTSTRA